MKKIFWWIIGGVGLTAAAFLIPEQQGSLWPSAIAATVVAFIYVIIFSAVWLRKVEAARKRKFMAVSLTLLLVFSTVSALISYESSARQHERLSTIRTYIESEVIKSNIHKPLIKTLAGYYSQDSDKNMRDVFTTKYDSLITQDSLFTFGNREEDQSIFIHLAKANPDSIVLVGESCIIEGKTTNFKNYSDKTGRFQVRGILTSKGISYEREN